MNIDDVVRSIQRDLTPQFEERLRAALAGKDREWLIDQVVRLTLDAHSLEEIDRRSEREAKAAARAVRLERVAALGLDRAAAERFVADHATVDRAGLLVAGAPAKGTAMLAAEHRTPDGEALLQHGKDVLYALLFGDRAAGVELDRVQHELLTLALPRSKAHALDIMRASTELAGAGTWQDPEAVSNDERADNVVLEVQFGDTAEELVGRGVIAALRIVNELEVNEQVLYARMVAIEETTLI